MDLVVRPARRVTGRFHVPPDRRLAQVAAVLSLVCPGTCTIDNWPQDHGLEALLDCLRRLGAQVAHGGVTMRITGKSAEHLPSSPAILECGNAPIGFLLLAGLLCGPLSSSPTALVGSSAMPAIPELIRVLSAMGAVFDPCDPGTGALNIRPAILHGVETRVTSVLPWVKLAVLAAGLSAGGATSVTEALPLPDDLERVLPAYGVMPDIAFPQRRVSRREEILQGVESPADREEFHKTVRVIPRSESLRPADWVLPGDCSLAAPLVAAAAMLPKSEVLIEDVALNPTHTGLLKVLKRMGAEISTHRRRMENGVPVGDIAVMAGSLKATKITRAEVPALVEEIPLLAVVAGSATGVTVIRGVTELKDTGLLPVGLITENLRRRGVKVAELEDGWAIEGPTEWRAAEIDSGGNAAVGMAFAIAGLLADQPTPIHSAECVTSRFPDFQRLIGSLAAG